MSQTMNYNIKSIILEYLGLEIIDYVEGSDTHLIFSDNETRHEKDVLDETIESMKEKLSEALEDNNFYCARRIISSLEDIMEYYEENWLA